MAHSVIARALRSDFGAAPARSGAKSASDLCQAHSEPRNPQLILPQGAWPLYSDKRKFRRALPRPASQDLYHAPLDRPYRR